jgi:hypothetical protein
MNATLRLPLGIPPELSRHLSASVALNACKTMLIHAKTMGMRLSH